MSYNKIDRCKNNFRVEFRSTNIHTKVINMSYSNYKIKQGNTRHENISYKLFNSRKRESVLIKLLE